MKVVGGMIVLFRVDIFVKMLSLVMRIDGGSGSIKFCFCESGCVKCVLVLLVFRLDGFVFC